MRRLSLLAIVSALALALAGVVGCSSEPVAGGELPAAQPWFEVDSVEVGTDGVTNVRGKLLPEAMDSIDATMTPAGAPVHLVYALYPEPDEVGMPEDVEIADDGSISVVYGLASRPEVLRRGWYVLRFDKADWGSQYIYVNPLRETWSATAP
jgi:hypothetical protein